MRIGVLGGGLQGCCVAVALAARGDTRRAASILGATEAAREAMGVECDEDEEAVRAHALSRLDRGGDDVEDAWAAGRELGLDEALALARSS